MKNKIVAVIMCFCLAIGISSVAYAEEKVSDWAKEEVEQAKSLNLIPQEMLEDDLTKNITRAEFAAIAVKLHHSITKDEKNQSVGYFADINDSIYEEYIKEAYNLGITKGTGLKGHDVVFSPDLNITRQELATMLCRVVKINKFENWNLDEDANFPLDISGAEIFADDEDIADYAKEPVYYLSKEGVIKGTDDTHFSPLDNATKEEAILLAQRIYKESEELPKLDINYEIIEKVEETTVGELIPDLEDKKYTIEDLAEIIDVKFHKTGEVLDDLGLIDCQSFEYNGYYVTIISTNEEASSSKEFDEYPTYIELSDTVKIKPVDIVQVRLNYEELPMQVGDVFKYMHAVVAGSIFSDVDIEWSSSNEKVATVEDHGETGYIYAEKEGVTYITAKFEEEGKTFEAKCKVVVEK